MIDRIIPRNIIFENKRNARILLVDKNRLDDTVVRDRKVRQCLTVMQENRDLWVYGV